MWARNARSVMWSKRVLLSTRDISSRSTSRPSCLQTVPGPNLSCAPTKAVILREETGLTCSCTMEDVRRRSGNCWRSFLRGPFKTWMSPRVPSARYVVNTSPQLATCGPTWEMNTLRRSSMQSCPPSLHGSVPSVQARLPTLALTFAHSGSTMAPDTRL